MLNPLSQSCFHAFSNQCAKHGFKKRGKAFFRVIGDGVLQILKYEYQRAGPHYSLNMGLFSMYGELEPQHFTSAGCVPDKCLMKLIGWKSTSRPDMFDADGNCARPPEQWYATPEEQLDVLTSKGFVYLDQINTQALLLKASFELDSFLYWNDYKKLAPFLFIEDYANALKVINALLAQHASAMQSYKEHFSLEAYSIRLQEQEENDQKLYALRDMIVKDDKKSIQAYLMENHYRNMLYAKFCRGKIGDDLREP